MRYMHQRWGPKALAIGENGLSLPSSPTLSLNDSLHDLQRIRWYRNAVEQINTILDEGKIPFVGYLAWSCISNFEVSTLRYARGGQYGSSCPYAALITFATICLHRTVDPRLPRGLWSDLRQARRQSDAVHQGVGFFPAGLLCQQGERIQCHQWCEQDHASYRWQWRHWWGGGLGWCDDAFAGGSRDTSPVVRQRYKCSSSQFLSCRSPSLLSRAHH